MKKASNKVVVKGLHSAIQEILPELDELWLLLTGYRLIITSGLDSKHLAKYSRHYWGGAIDIRTWTTATSGIQITGRARMQLLIAVRQQLGNDFNVLNEVNHFHIGFRPQDLSWKT